MKKLIAAGLFGQGLTVISSPVLINRYNECLKRIGQEASALEQFSVDGMGWSPEIYLERKDRLYLTQGLANQFAIILTPEQKNQPHYFPICSFTRTMLGEFFKEFSDEIADITGTSALIINLNEGLSELISPLDLFMIESVTLNPDTSDGLIEGAREQQELVEKFYKDKNWFDPGLRQQIICSKKKYGDLRRRRVLLPDFVYKGIRSFHTMAFGGAYILRRKNKAADPLLVLSDEKQAKELGREKPVYYLRDPELTHILYQYGLVAHELEYYRENRNVIPMRLQSIFMEVLSHHRPDVDPLTLTPGQKQRHINELRGFLPEVYRGLERINRQILNNKAVEMERLPISTRQAVLYPPKNLPQSTREVVWRLITERKYPDIFTLYVYNKALFYELYQNWTEQKQRWAIAFIKSSYKPLNQKGR